MYTRVYWFVLRQSNIALEEGGCEDFLDSCLTLSTYLMGTKLDCHTVGTDIPQVTVSSARNQYFSEQIYDEVFS